MKPTAPPQNRGSPSTGTNLYSERSALSAVSGSSPGASVRLRLLAVAGDGEVIALGGEHRERLGAEEGVAADVLAALYALQ